MGICKNNLPPHSWRRGPVFNNSRNANVYFLISRASNTFCQMGCGMLSSIGDFLKMGSDEIIRNMYDNVLCYVKNYEKCILEHPVPVLAE